MKKMKSKPKFKPRLKRKRGKKRVLSEDEAFGLFAQEIVKQIDSGKMKVKPFKLSDLD